MKNYKKILAATLAMTMVAGSSVMAAAPSNKSYVSANDFEATTSSDATGTVNGTGGMEGQVSEDVFCVVVPSSVQGNNAATFDGFNFVMDPQKLITQTEAAKYVTGSNITADGFVPGKTLYFVNRTDRQLDDTSDYVKVTNKSSIGVDITLDAKMKNYTGIKLSDTKTFADDSVSMYMAVIGNGTEAAIKETDGAKVTGNIPKAKDGAYDTVYVDGTGYEYKLVSTDPADFSTYEFALTGACNDKADWLGVNSAIAPEVELTWSVEPATASSGTAPSISTTTYTVVENVATLIPLEFGSGSTAATGIESITYKNSSGADTVLATEYYTVTDANELRIKPSYTNTAIVQPGLTRQYTVTFNDAAKTKVVITLGV